MNAVIAPGSVPAQGLWTDVLDVERRQALIFWNPIAADAWARRNLRIPIYQHIDGLQACFCINAARPGEEQRNLLSLHPESMIDQLTMTRFRHPSDVATSIVFPNNIDAMERCTFTARMQAAFAQAAVARKEREHSALDVLHRMEVAGPRAPRPLRVFMRASRYGPVLQYSCHAMKCELETLDCRVHLSIEKNEWERLSRHHWLEEILAFAPDLYFSMNRNVAEECPTGCIQVQWWQDITDELRRGEPVAWRAEDLVYCIDRTSVAPHLMRRGLERERVRLQSQCVIPEVFAVPVPSPGQRRRSLVFVGNLYHPDLSHCDAQAVARFHRKLRDQIEAGELFLTEEVAAFATELALPPAVFCNAVWPTILRTTAMSWLVAMAGSGWEISIYGAGWDGVDWAVPHHRGLIRTDEELAAVYHQSSHAVSIHPLLINHQRLSELGGAGCRPVVYDCRATAERPHWAMALS